MSQQPQTRPDEPTPAPRSGGPKTPEGKERSRRNALKHGLRAKVLTPDEMIDDVMNRTVDFVKELQPRTVYQEWLVSQIVLATVQLDRCAALGIVDLQRRINHAEPCWELDRRRDIGALASGLKTNPDRVQRALEATRHGVDWLLEHWDGLAEVLDDVGAWDEAQTRLALDLLGTPPELRHIRRLPAPAELPHFVQEEISRLCGLQESFLNDLDDDQCFQASLGMPTGSDPTSASLRRYERSCRRTLHWAQAELKRLQSEPAEPSAPAPQAQAQAQAQPEPVPEPCPPRDDSHPFPDLRAARMMALGSRVADRPLTWTLPPQDHFDLGFPMVPPRSDNGSASPPRPAGAGNRA
jgi:hypothetical protein